MLDRHMMTHLPEPVSEQDIMEMFRSISKMFLGFKHKLCKFSKISKDELVRSTSEHSD